MFLTLRPENALYQQKRDTQTLYRRNLNLDFKVQNSVLNKFGAI